MASKRDSLFPTGSIGRNSSISRTASHESLSAHPLLSPPPPGLPTAPTFADSTTAGAPRYVPYTPRHRITPSSATTGTIMQPSMSAPGQQHTPHSDATSRLQLMNLKAAAQRIELDASSTGWAILERLSTETDHGPDWNDIWSALSHSKATLLLPLDNYNSNDPITAEFIKNHIALCDGAGRNNTPVVTLSGLRGTLTDTTLLLRSAISPSTASFQALLSPAARSSALAALPPLPTVLVQNSAPRSPSSPSSSISALLQYPTFHTPSYAPALPIPPRPSVTKPPLPPRPGARAVSGPAQPSSRLANPFASFFGRATPPASPSTTPSTLQSEPHPISLSGPGSTGASASQTGETSDRSNATDHSLDVPAYTISSRIDLAVVGRSLTDTITGELRAILAEATAPSWVIEHVERFVRPLFPLTNTASTGDANTSKAVSSTDGGVVGRALNTDGVRRRKGSDEWVVSTIPPEERADEMSNKFQAFYIEVEDMLWARLPKEKSKSRKGRGSRLHVGRPGKKDDSVESVALSVTEEGSEADEGSDEKVGDEREVDEEERRTALIRTIMDAVERVLCCLFYDRRVRIGGLVKKDPRTNLLQFLACGNLLNGRLSHRLFLPANTDDAEHDAALSSRIAAVNLLDLSLGHLGVDVGNSSREVEGVVGECGKALVDLDAVCRSPAEKATILVSVHKIIVGGLAKLPPIGLKPEDEIVDKGKTPRAKTTFGRHSTGGDDDAISSELVASPQEEPVKDQLNVDTTSEDSNASPTIVLSPVDGHPAQRPLPALLSEHALSASSQSATVVDDMIPPPPRSASLPRASSPLLTTSRASSPTPVSGDVILPLMIFAVVKVNPPRLVSNLLYIQRFRRESAGGGEEGYCLINLMAVAEFLENVDLAALGLGDNENMVLSPAQLSPIPLSRSVRGAPPTSPQVMPPSLRGRVEQQVDAITGSANKVLSGVVDSSFGVLRSLLPGQNQMPSATPAAPNTETIEEPARPGFGLLRRDTGFSIASLAASLPGGRGSRSGQGEESGQQMIEVPSRPGSSRSVRIAEDETTTSDDETTGDEDEDEEGEDEEHGHDTRSIRSFESMMGGRSRKSKGRRKPTASGRISLTDRLANMPGLSRLSQPSQSEVAKNSPPGSRRSSLYPATTTVNRFDTPVSSRAASPILIQVSPPNPRFMTCTEDDIKVSEVGELLREYKRLAEAVRAMGGFSEDT